MVTIAVASDLHAADEGAQNSFLLCGASRVPWKQHPVEALKRLIGDEGLTADFLVCPGDFADGCSIRGLATGWSAIREIADSLGAQIVGTIGNHDVDSHHRYAAADVFSHARGVAPEFPMGDLVANQAYWADGFAILANEAAAFLVVNSSTEHSTIAAAKCGSVTDALLESIEDSLSEVALPELRVAVVHHHPHLHEELGLGAADVMHGGSELMALLASKGFQLIVHGHKHHPKLSYAAGDTGSLVVFAAGSLCHINYAQLASNTRNLFHVLKLSPSTLPDCTVFGEVLSWEYNSGDRWNPATIRSASFPFYAGFGCRQTVAQLVGSVETVLVGRQSWSDLLSAIPRLRYILPTTREQVIAELRARGYLVLRDDLGEPVELAPGGG